MLLIRKLLGGYKNMVATIAQLIILALLLPGFAYVASFIVPDATLNALVEIFQSVPVFGYFFKFFDELSSASVKTIELIPFLSYMIEILEEEIFSATVIGMCLYATKLIGNKLKMRGLPILQIVIGTIIGVFLVFYAKLESEFSPGAIAVLIVLLIIDVVLTFVLEAGQHVKKVVSFLFGISLSAFTAAASLAYISVTTLIAVGAMPDLKTAVVLLGTTAIPFLIFVAIDFYLMMPKRKN